MTRRQTGVLIGIGGLPAILSSVLTYGSYLGSPASPAAEPLPDLRWIGLTQVLGYGLLAAGCHALSRPRQDARIRRVGRPLAAVSFLLVSLFPVPVWVGLHASTFSPMFVLLGAGYLGIGGLAVSMSLLAPRLPEMVDGSSCWTALGVLSVPIGGAGYWLFGRFGLGSTPRRYSGRRWF